MRNKVVIVCIIKDEEKYIREFCQYHLALGFDKIYLGDNTPPDKDSPYGEILKDFIGQGTVEMIDVRGKQNYQNTFYNETMDLLSRDSETQWALFIDVDEHLTLVRDKNVHEFMDKLPHANQVMVNWLMMDSCGQVRYEDRPLEERFPNKIDAGENPNGCCWNNHVKCFVRIIGGGERIGSFNLPHNCSNVSLTTDPLGKVIPSSPFNNNPDYSVAYIKHFHLKSIQEYVENKMMKGWSDRNGNSLNWYVKDFKYFNPTPQAMSWLLEKVYKLTH